jgi:hypothetical protein
MRHDINILPHLLPARHAEVGYRDDMRLSEFFPAPHSIHTC